MLAAVVLGLLALQATAAPPTPETDATPKLVTSDLYFWLFNSATGTRNPVRLYPDQLRNSALNRNLPLKFLIHGWEDSVDADWYQPTIEAYLRTGNINIIAFDWERYALGNYIDSVRSAREVAVFISTFLQQVNDVVGLPLRNVHLIGHSLGAHISGFTGKRVLTLTHTPIGRITGLDPAGPLFNGNAADSRLARTDATFVDVLHTDGAILGFGDDLGDADFFPNGGTAFQEGCWIWQFGCSHNRAPRYFTESISNRNAFVGRSCTSESNFNRGQCSSNSVAVFGENTPTNARGRFYFTTNNGAPFGRGNNGI